MSLLVRLHDGTEHLGVELVTVGEMRRRAGGAALRPRSESDRYMADEALILLDGVQPAWLCPVIVPAQMLGVIEQSDEDRRVRHIGAQLDA